MNNLDGTVTVCGINDSTARILSQYARLYRKPHDQTTYHKAKISALQAPLELLQTHSR